MIVYNELGRVYPSSCSLTARKRTSPLQPFTGKKAGGTDELIVDANIQCLQNKCCSVSLTNLIASMFHKLQKSSFVDFMLKERRAKHKLLKQSWKSSTV